MQTSGPVTSRLEFKLVLPGGASLAVIAVLAYDPEDPWAVRICFHTGGDGDEVVEWLFARSLLADGMRRSVGFGDVRVWPGLGQHSSQVHLSMTSPTGSALFELDRAPLVDFLDRSYEVVALGAEPGVIDLDRELTDLLG